MRRKALYYSEKYFRRPFSAFFKSRSKLFYYLLPLYLLLNSGMLYLSWFIVDLSFDSEMEVLISKYVLVSIIFLPLALILVILAIILKIMADRIRMKAGTILRFKFVTLFILVSIIPSAFFLYMVNNITNEALDIYFKDKVVEGLQYSLENLEDRVMDARKNAASELQALESLVKNFLVIKEKEVVLESDYKKEIINNLKLSKLDGLMIFKEKKLLWKWNAGRNSKPHSEKIKEGVDYFDGLKNDKRYTTNSLESTFYHPIENIILAGRNIQGYEKNVNILGLVTSDPILSQDISERISAITRIAQFHILRNQFKNILLVLYFYFYFPILSLGVLVFYIFTAQINRPISDLNRATQLISRDDYTFRLNIRGNDGIATLVKSFKFMSRELLYNREKLKDMTQIAAWKEVAVRLAHELKNPLTPIQLASDSIQTNIMKKDFDMYSDLLPSFNLIYSEVEHIRHLIKEFSHYSKDLDINKEDINYFEMFQSFELQLDIIKNVKTEFKNNISKDLIGFLDQRSIRQVVLNLIQNASESLSSPDENSKIQIITDVISALGKEEVLLRVIDNGPGISEASKDKIFNPYFTTKESGTGLGLSICKRIINRHKGRLEFFSTEESTEFKVTLPIVVGKK